MPREQLCDVCYEPMGEGGGWIATFVACKKCLAAMLDLVRGARLADQQDEIEELQELEDTAVLEVNNVALGLTGTDDE